MAYKLLKFVSLDNSVDRESGEQKIYANFTELQPERKRVNLSKADASTLAAFRALEGKIVMLSAEDRFFKGDEGIFAYLQLQKGDGLMPLIFEAPESLLTAQPRVNATEPTDSSKRGIFNK